METKADVGSLPHWDLSNIYPGLETKEFTDAVSQAKAKLDELDAYVSEHQISRSGARPKDSRHLAEIMGGYLDNLRFEIISLM